LAWQPGMQFNQEFDEPLFLHDGIILLDVPGKL
jgi:hypothetical protein